jgi:hypothetical protein
MESNVEAACDGSLNRQIRPVISRKVAKEAYKMALNLTRRLELLYDERFYASATREYTLQLV